MMKLRRLGPGRHRQAGLRVPYFVIYDTTLFILTRIDYYNLKKQHNIQRRQSTCPEKTVMHFRENDQIF